MTQEPRETRVFLCYEPDEQSFAERIDGWPVTNQPLAAYCRRLDMAWESDEAESAREKLRDQIEAADVVVCIISGTTHSSRWVEWELETAQECKPRKGLVGILLKDHVEPPSAMVNRGAIFVAFKRDKVERAVQWATEEERTEEDYMLEDE